MAPLPVAKLAGVSAAQGGVQRIPRIVFVWNAGQEKQWIYSGELAAVGTCSPTLLPTAPGSAMIARRFGSGGDTMLPRWAQGFILLAVAVAQVIPLMIGTYLVATTFRAAGDGSFSAQRLAAGVCFLGVAGATFIALYRDLRFGERYNHSRAMIVSIVLLVAGAILNRP